MCDPFHWCHDRKRLVARRAIARGELLVTSSEPLCAVQCAHNRPTSVVCAACYAPLTSVSESLALATGALGPADVISSRTSKVPLLPNVAVPELAAADSPARCTKSLNGEFFYCSERCHTAAMQVQGAHLLCAHTADEGHPCNQLQELCCIDSFALAARHFSAAVAAARARGICSEAELVREVADACAPLVAEQPAVQSWHAEAPLLPESARRA